MGKTNKVKRWASDKTSKIPLAKLIKKQREKA